MHKLTVTLKQHTPLIHFQHDQEGATLRASEVKPKLDRFILKKLGGGIYKDGVEEAQKKDWLIGIKSTDEKFAFEKSKQYALNYKMRFVAGEEKEEYLITSNLKKDFVKTLNDSRINVIPQTPYFAQEKQVTGIVGKWGVNEKNWEQIPKKGILSLDNIEMTIFCMLPDLLKCIGKYVREFFFIENFGTRQNKGFGSFCVTDLTPNDIEKIPITIEDALKNNFCTVYKSNRTGSYNTPEFLQESFRIIQNDYQLLKAGKNHVKYAKSKLFLYGVSLNSPIRWEKRFIKREIYKSSHSSSSSSPRFPYELLVKGGNSNVYGKNDNEQKWEDEEKDKFNYKYLRAVLGIAEQFEFIIFDNSGWNNQSKKKYIVKLKETTGEIERFKSPITFKIINDSIYLLGNELPENFKGDFNLYVSVKDDENFPEEKKIKLTEEKISIPENFSIKEFLEFAMTDNTNNESLNYIKIK